jgi:Spy/CpxP family protein refolding chaperone
MLGFILGAVCAVGLAKALRRRRAWHSHYSYGGFGGPGPACSSGWDAGLRRGGPRSRAARWALRSLFERLETTPGQERVIQAAFEELRENRQSLREEVKQTRADLARAIESGLIDDSTLEETYARQDRLLARLRVSFTEALKKIVEVLDEPQRKHLADWLQGGFFRSGAPWIMRGPGDVWV